MRGEQECDDGRMGAMSGDAASAVARCQGKGLNTPNPPTRHGTGRTGEDGLNDILPRAVSGPFVPEAEIEAARRIVANHQRGFSYPGKVRAVVLRLYHSGLSADEVGRRIGIHGNVVLSWVKAIGIQPSNTRRTPRTKPEPSPEVSRCVVDEGSEKPLIHAPSPKLCLEDRMRQRWLEINIALPPGRINGRTPSARLDNFSIDYISKPRRPNDDLRAIAEYAVAHGTGEAAARFGRAKKTVQGLVRQAKRLGLFNGGGDAA